MALLFVILVVALAVTIGVGIIAHRQGWSLAGGPSAWGERLGGRFGAIGGALLALIPGCVVVYLLGLALGALAKGTESGFDRPIFDWVHGHVTDNLFTRLNGKFTQMGNNPIVEVVCTISIILLAFAYKRRWWLPTISIAGAFLDEKFVWKFLGKVIHRDHPIAGFGGFPSGGVGRLISIYGVIVLLAIMLVPRISRAWKAGLWIGLATAGVVEAFTRIYLSKHWTADVLFALVLGTLLLMVNIAAVTAFARITDRSRPEPPAQSRATAPAATADSPLT